MILINQKQIYELNITQFDYINIYKLHNILKCWDFSNDDIKTINISINGENISNINYKNNNISNISFIFPSDDHIIKNLNNLFNNNSSEKIENIVTNILLHDNILTNSIIVESNNKTLELLNNNDFVTLLKIYNTNPDVFELLYKYTQNGSVIKSLELNNTNIDDIDYYNFLTNKIYNLNIITDKNKIMSYLIKHSGHLNLTLRDLLNT